MVFSAHYIKKIRVYILSKCTQNILKVSTFLCPNIYWGHKINLNKFKSIEIISNIFSDHNSLKLETCHRKRNEKKMTIGKLNNVLLKNQWVNKEIKREIKKNTLRKFIMKIKPFKIYGMLQKQFLEGSS